MVRATAGVTATVATTSMPVTSRTSRSSRLRPASASTITPSGRRPLASPTLRRAT